MAIETHLYPSNAGFQSCDAQNRMIDFNSHLQHLCKQSEEQLPPQHLGTYDATNKYHNSLTAAVEFDEQIDEVDRYIKLQNEKLRIMLQDQRKQQMLALLKTVESRVLYVLNQKNEQIAQAAMKMSELEEFLRRLEAENQSWQRAAQENEAMVLSLHSTLEQIQERNSYCFNNGVATEDAESCCDENRRNMAMEEGAGENSVCYGGRVEEAQIMACKCCHFRRSCFMFLPCRHLCSCNVCEPFLQSCPVCRMPKKYSIETLIS